MKLAFFFSGDKWSGKLTNFFTGCYCYHVAFVDLEQDIMYDMHLIRRKRRWSTYGERKNAYLVDCPVNVSASYLEEQLLVDHNWYGVGDYLLFILRPIYHFFGRSTRNADGVICSEMVYFDLYAHGWQVHFTEVPSPCALWNLFGE